MPAPALDFSPDTYRAEWQHADALFGPALTDLGRHGLRVLYDSRADVAEIYLAVAPVERDFPDSLGTRFVGPRLAHEAASKEFQQEVSVDPSCAAWDGALPSAEDAPLQIVDMGTGSYDLRLMLPSPAQMGIQQRMETVAGFVSRGLSVRAAVALSLGRPVAEHVLAGERDDGPEIS